MSFHVGEIIGDYRIIGIIGAGAMGRVFQAEHRITKRKEALKVLTADLADESQIARFTREIEVQARLSHPNIAAVHNAFRSDDRFVLVMELVEGQTLENLLRQGRIPLETGLGYIRQTLAALNYAHENGVVHRDVTPANLMVTSSGCVKLMDFGVAKSLGDFRLTDAGSMVGSLYYMAPEQVKGSAGPNPRMDIYSAGAVLYQIATGRRPFEYEDRYSLMIAQVQEEPEPPVQVEPMLPVGLSEAILKALAKDPGCRYQSAGEFLKSLDGIGACDPLDEQLRPDRPKERESPWMSAAAAVLAVLFMGGGTITWRNIHPPAPPIQQNHWHAPAPPMAAPVAPLSPPSKPTQAVSKDVHPDPVVAVRKPVPHPFVGPQMPPAPVAPVVATAPAALQTQPTPPAQPAALKKDGIWSKLNPFRKKKEDPAKRTAPAETALHP